MMGADVTPPPGEAQSTPRWRYLALALVFGLAITFDVYHVGHLTKYSLGALDAVAAPVRVDAISAAITAVRDEAANGGIRAGDHLVAVNGQPLVSIAVYDRVVVGAQPGDIIRLTVSTGAQPARDVVIPLVRRGPAASDNRLVLFLVAVLLPLACQALGFLVAFRRPLDPRSWLLLAAALGFGHRLTLTSEFREGTWLARYSLGYLLTVVPLYSGWLFWLATRFPSRLAIDRRLPWVKWIVLGPLFVLTFQNVVFQEALLFDRQLGAWLLSSTRQGWATASLLRNTCLGLFIVVMGIRYLTERTPDAKRRLRLFGLGAVCSLAPIEVLVQVARYRGVSLDVLVPTPVLLPCLLLTLLFPVTLAYVIVVPRAPAVGGFIRQNLYRPLSPRGMVAIRLALGVLVVALLHSSLVSPGGSAVLWTITGLVVMMVAVQEQTFGGTRNWIDRNVFHDAHRLETALEHFEIDASAGADHRDLLAQATAKLSRLFEARNSAVLVAENDALCRVDGGMPDTALALGVGSAVTEHLTRDPTPTTTYFDDRYSWVQRLPESERLTLRELGSTVLVPVVDQGLVLAVIVLGEKPLNLPYSEAELQLLRVIARQTRLAMTNASLHARIAAEAAIRARVEAEKVAAETASQAKTTFLASMSHELRTPMNAILGYSEMLIEDAEDRGAGDTVADLQKIHSAGQHLLELINSVLDISKIEAGKMTVYVEPFMVQDLVENVAQIVRPLVMKNANRLVVDIDRGIGQLTSDRTKLRQSLFNLVSNATKFTKDGTITIQVTPERREGRPFVAFAVRDSGIGMSPEQLVKLFQPFSQADASITSKYGGTGLGLTITKEFSEMLGGTVTVNSELGVGTTFTLHLPLAVAAEPEPEPEPLADNDQPVILLIDDDPVVHDQVRRLLAREGVRVVSASTGDKGLELAAECDPRAILLDVMMSGIDGWQVLSRLKSDPALASIPVIMLTVIDQQNAGFALGAREYFVKPIERDRLARVVAACCGPIDASSSKSVLVVDDQADGRRMLRRMFEESGWEIAEAEDGRRALDIVVERPPDLILLDLMMPGMDGFSFMDNLRQTPRGASIPVIVVTAKDLTDAERARLNEAVSNIIEKRVYNTDTLLAEVQRQLHGLLQDPTGATSG